MAARRSKRRSRRIGRWFKSSHSDQKCFTTDFLTKSKKVNEGEVPQYYIEHSHEAIIVPEEWDAVQEELARRKRLGKAYSGKSVFGAKIKCGDCGGWYGMKVWHSNDAYRSKIWRCNCKYEDGKPHCQTPAIRDEDIQERFISAMNGMIADKAPYIAACETAKAMLTDMTGIDAEIQELLREMEVVAGLTKKCIEENSASAQDQEEYTARYNGYVDRYEKAKARYDALSELRSGKQAKAKAIDRFIAMLSQREELLTEFDNRLWLTMVDYAEVHRDNKITFCFYDGTEITN